MKNKVNRLLALVLVICTILGLGGIPAQAASIADGTQTCTVALGMRNNYLVTTAGTTLRAGDYTYTTNDGLSGPAYCIDHGLDYTDEVLPVVGKYTASPATAGAFANGYPQHSVDTFLGLYLKDNAVLAGLTEAEYAYATQTAVWATLGQLGVDGTPYTAGREYLNPPTGDTQQTRVFRATQLILNAANTWDRVYQTGMYIRLDENAPGGNIAIDSTMTLECAANENQYGIKREVINGKSYYTREYIFASATSTYYSEYSIELWADNAPEGTIFTDLNNVELARSNFREKATWRLPTEPHYNVGSQINNNGYEYWGKAKLCIPVDTATPSGEITINCAAYVMQYEIYLANNEDYTEQSYILADPSKGTQTADAVLSWGSDITEVGSLMVKKVGGGGEPLAGAEFILTGSSGTNLTGTTDADGEIFWNNLNPKEVFTLMESKAPSGYGVVEPRNVQIIAAHTTFETVKDDPLRTLTVHKQDVQTNYSLRGATFCFEQINGDFKITKVTDHAGNIQLNADQLPLGSYKVYEEAAPEGYNLDSKPQTVNWDGKRDVTMTFTDSRKLTLILSKQDAYTHYNLPGASFEVYRDGQLVTTVTTNEAGLAYVHDVKVGYFEIKETVAPEGYTFNDKTYGINIDPYDPATTDDPRLVITNEAMPSLRITKYDRQSMKPLADATFKVYKDTTLMGSYTTDRSGQILVTGLEPGTYTVQEVAVPGTHIVDTTPQQVEIAAGRKEPVTLAFFNDLRPGLRLVKVDANDPAKTIQNAVFEIKAVNGSYGPKEITTDKDGEIDLSSLPTGSYVVTEKFCPGYVVDDAQRIVELKPNEDAEFVFTNSKLPTVTLRKQNAQGQPMEGVTFSLTKAGTGAHADERTTNAQGTITWEGLEPGLYSLKEVATKSTHVLDATEHHVQLYPGKDAELLLVNEEKPSLKITKFDRQSGQPMSGVVFEVFKDTVSLGKHRTNAKGEILLAHIDPGTYKAAETDTGNDTHILVTTPQEVELHAGDGVRELTFFNERLPGLHLVKVDAADLSKPIPNAKFRFRSIKGDYGPVELTTGADGTIDLSKLPVGSYEVVELECPGYVVDKAQRLIHLDGNETGQFVFTNTRLPRFELTKHGADGKPLEGVTYRIAYVEDGTRYMDKTTDTDGKIALEGLEPGVLSIRETATLPNYILDPTEHHVELKVGQTATVELKNDRRPNLTIHKTDADTDEPVPGTTFLVKTPDGPSIAEVTTDKEGKVTVHNMLPGVYEVSEKSVPAPYLQDAPAQTVTLYPNKDRDVTFKNHKKPGLTINKLDSITGDPIQGVKFSVTYASNNTDTGEINDLGSYTTDQNGQIYLDRLKDGWYKATELAPKSGYAIKGSATQECYIKAGTSKVLTFENTPLSALVVYKYDSITGAAVEGATFQVKYLAGSSGTGGTVIGTYKTSANGSFTVTGLKAGTYIVEELAPDENHVIDAAPQTALISGKDQDVVQLYFGNSPKASLTVKKIDAATHAPLSDVEFLVTLADGSLVGDANGKFVTDSSGSFTISGLNPGTSLVVKETRAKAGYILDDAPQTITVKAGQAASLEFRNQPKGSVLVKKVDAATGKPLSDVKFMVTTDSGAVVGTANGKYVTDASGSFTVAGVSPGTTLIVRENRAKAGYILDDTPQTAVVQSGKIVTLEFRNMPKGALVIVKRDADSKKPLQGAEFRVTTSDGKYVDAQGGKVSSKGLYTTDKEGQIIITGLEPCTVVVTETKAPRGYVLDKTPQTVAINANDTQTLYFYDKPTPTGDLKVLKLDEETRQPIQGVEFSISRINGERLGLYRTNSKGVIYLESLEPGWYTVTETKAAKDYRLDAEPKDIEVKHGKTATLEVTNRLTGSALIHKVDSVTGKGIYGVTFLVSDAKGNPVGQYTSDQDGYVYVNGELADGKYTIREIQQAEGYLPDTTVKTFWVEYGGCSTITWYNTPCTGQIQITKTSADYNPTNGWPAGTPIPGCEFEVYNKAGNLVDTIRTDKNGVAATRALPLGQYKVVESKAADFYALDATPFYAELQFAGQIVRIAATNKSVTTGVSITKTGYKEVMPGQVERFTFTGIGNTSTVALQDFYWRDTIPADALRLAKVTTGTWNVPSSYKLVYLTNKSGGQYRTLADNLSTSKNYTIDASPVALGLARDEYVTEVMAVFGVVPAGFHQVEAPALDFTVVGWLQNGYQFTNQADAGGSYNGAWVQANTRWVTTVYAPTKPLPRTGY